MARAQRARAARQDGRAMESKPGASRRILVVDDNPDGVETLSRLLRLMGNEVRTAHDGQEALEAAEAFRPDVAVLDIGLPTIDGYEAARRMREQPWGRDMILVALTGWGQEEDRRRAQEAGFDHHLVKPVNAKTLREALAGRRA
jgi:CheY-like chemotaxis protein